MSFTCLTKSPLNGMSKDTVSDVYNPVCRAEMINVRFSGNIHWIALLYDRVFLHSVGYMKYKNVFLDCYKREKKEYSNPVTIYIYIHT
jgi:hypothetical protein